MATGVIGSAAGPADTTGVSATAPPVDALDPYAQQVFSQVNTNLGFGPPSPPATAIFLSGGGGIGGVGGSGQVTYIPGNNNICLGGQRGLALLGLV